ncbi:deoxyribodipyrimidine photo-lyase [Daejeonella rubra]|uniref:Deoxyribodipyrimidine photo-lyase n=1 Tax=Daejeonella rubra TaxID=990371 RepID=A0A1G9UBC2_9SPHI|nr:deoxyribodipyrimidine photo-lyase [Daejeonella rubra]SDM57143.1 deoxyribodipyrimidine photo-lyase [Daejeonella rubra]
MKKEVSICWLRRDLRLNDNNALFKALTGQYPVLPIFIFDPDILDKLSDKQDKRVTFIHRTLEQLNEILKQNGSALYVLHEGVEKAFQRLTDEYIVKEVYANHDYEPYAISRDLKIKGLLDSKGIPFKTFKDQVIFEKSDVMKSDGTPYTIFTPYSRKWKEKFSQGILTNFPSEEHFSALLRSREFAIPSLKELGFENTAQDFPELNITEERIRNYQDTRNIPSEEGTSQVSVQLRFGTLSVRDLVKLAVEWNEQWLNELIWREFFMMILYHFPNVVSESFKKKYDKIQWRNNEREFELWCKGETGYPIVDAGMRQLNETGLMHNRVRMITAGFLCKHLLIDWRWGEAYFAQKLLDYELSSNNGNWQWAAGSGCDSAPYFRIFNPTAQTLKFDPKLKYIKTWIKDFRVDYLYPVVDHEFARKRALEVYKKAVND